MASLEPRLSQFGPAFGWLISRDVSSARLASLFGTTAENIRVIAFRARRGEFAPAEPPAALARKPDAGVAAGAGIRPGLEDAEWTPARTRKLESLDAQINEIVSRRAAQYEFLAGVRELRQVLPQFGYAADARRIALLGQLHQHIAWFLVHSGWCFSAAREAGIARDLWRTAWYASGSQDDGEGFVKAALIGSHAWLLSRRPEDAIRFLDVARDAANSLGSTLGSDHYRQRGVALLQLRQDDEATVQFRESAVAMEKLNEAQVPAQILMTGQRHIGLLGRSSIDQSWDVAAAAERAFGHDSLEASMALHWAAATCLSSDSRGEIQQAIEALNGHPAPLAEFGHQATIRRLLLITPELGLDDRLRRVWVRRALYENAQRRR